MRHAVLVSSSLLSLASSPGSAFLVRRPLRSFEVSVLRSSSPFSFSPSLEASASSSSTAAPSRNAPSFSRLHAEKDVKGSADEAYLTMQLPNFLERTFQENPLDDIDPSDFDALGIDVTKEKAELPELLQFVRDRAFVDESLVVQNVDAFEVISKLLPLKGYAQAAPWQREELHPMMVPFGRPLEGPVPKTHLAEKGGGKQVGWVGLLRLPHVKDEKIPVVRQCPTGLELVSNNLASLAMKWAVELHAEGNEEVEEIIPEVNRLFPDSKDHFSTTDERLQQLGPVRYIYLRKWGPFPDVCEALIDLHIEKNDGIAASTVAEKYQESFIEWGRPHALRAVLTATVFADVVKAKEIAKMALKKPSFTVARTESELKLVNLVANEYVWDERREVFLRKSQDPQTSQVATGMKVRILTLLERAAWYMDAMMFGLKAETETEGEVGALVPWSACREALSDFYREGQLFEFASFVGPLNEEERVLPPPPPPRTEVLEEEPALQ
uniref:Uncharacterized protein n=1 Tax=Chromera velia CCMP2878 TaxID=1169474 RepID=A0A0G4G9Y7_9ALVE|mmetsp:Transcript_12337/g.23936  ORF Transcript_12337/g.23936 Transcript_12337/m.23936 type:complete len:497 (+) Transcript_12337:287-1777(+)|eukprot:Cvel_20802.t1-p1 / transcript=Cvel_20802.t1 / gene=Cvel_20802 / organism=Chromera_velia_CCMP2878 / gene_product=hypothetical protein / transcript_product=hypothetical protein / location=Cvel_scaffold1900:19172-23983(-) / protein_length=496 / sequence_SO=supercontig / SO=protein_coding / is_pseudo=false